MNHQHNNLAQLLDIEERKYEQLRANWLQFVGQIAEHLGAVVVEGSENQHNNTSRSCAEGEEYS